MREAVNRLVGSILGTEGHVSQDLRKAVADYSSSLDGDDSSLPEPTRSYLEKVKNAAYKVTDSDIDGLKSAGFSEDEIYELTVVAAVGAGSRRFDRFESLLNDEGGQI